MAHGIPRNKSKMSPKQKYAEIFKRQRDIKRSYNRNPNVDWQAEEIFYYSNNEIS